MKIVNVMHGRERKIMIYANFFGNEMEESERTWTREFTVDKLKLLIK
jgi:hypothetical protein